MRVSVLYPFPTERTWCHCLHLCSVLWAPLVRHFISVGEEPQHPEEGSSEVSCCSKGIHQNKCMLKGRIYETLEFLGCWLLNHVCHVISQIINSPMSSIILISHRVVILTTNSFKRLVFYINTTMEIKEKVVPILAYERRLSWILYCTWWDYKMKISPKVTACWQYSLSSDCV